MRRILVVGAGFFGALVARRLREVGLAPLVATRRGADVRLDAEDEVSIDAVLRPGDVIVDTAGPFALRSTRLVRAAIDRGCDVIDLSESLAWAEAIVALGSRAAAAGVRLYPACSAVAAVTGACVATSGIAGPRSVDQFLAPASAETASPATIASFVRSLGVPIRTLRDGALVTVRGYGETRAFPGSRRRGGLVESASAVLLPRSWPSLRRAEFWVDPNTPLGRTALSAAAGLTPLAALARQVASTLPARRIGRHDGIFAVAVADGSRCVSFALTAPRRSYLIAVEPAVIAAEALARGPRGGAGIVAPHAQVDAELLFARLRSLAIDVRGATL
ncbi:MAG TPA: saccharopine dehydrogenase NADP-binding domain-containing protein [Candidatus Limnocylindria bacterium]|nr:saccharopine dehydrogenase NADP-binding domain-containing protein [Candidatus Limnocylindria bacterium]